MTVSGLLIVLLVLVFISTLPLWQYSASWGYGPSGIVGAVAAILLVLWLLGPAPA